MEIAIARVVVNVRAREQSRGGLGFADEISIEMRVSCIKGEHKMIVGDRRDDPRRLGDSASRVNSGRHVFDANDDVRRSRPAGDERERIGESVAPRGRLIGARNPSGVND